MRERPYHFLRVGSRWINMALVTDVRDDGEKMSIYLSAPMLGRAEQTVTGGRRIVLKDPENVANFRKWIRLNDEEVD